ncbi:MAG: hypothetical protein COU10_00560 [Candidatus Harrisonbacteria bacterium CG10_big_fil_rev_8_21_14_0_10_45_28]|uniref:DNA polymerase III subunit gamma/tau n=1 Tax=Candidatus Harrisonbacteria bacterium CG10_big_fil_rev_8_21_14_0_10_45_28 TaxID=1974586 RepID=A0A2H0UP34_9BACT|nr:MAG: hypothetical protein COU10_00560 [Candidatus Harrisonbacteria bacterium CG10_big_fil_rev_8_21_14_0_10_45_28]
MAQALYRKYRPKTFADVFGQSHVVTVLKNAAKADRLSHAYLFYGPRGSGKTTIARLLAKVANCQTRQDDATFAKKGEPCNKCGPCEEISAGRGIDVIEIDAASNRGIDEIRSLKEGIRLSPSSYKHKVVIIDETHMLTKEAFNALLKTLEEPPAHAILILATTELDKVPATITSRTQRFHFTRHTVADISKKLESIAEIEKINIDKDAIELIASLAEGSFRDGESLIQQAASLADKITLKTIEAGLGQVGLDKTTKLAELILTRELKSALAYLKEVDDMGLNVIDLTKELVHYLRKILTLKFNPDLEADIARDLTTKELAQLKTITKQTSPDQLIAILKSLIRAFSEMRYSPFASIPLEIAIIENLREK